MEGTSEASLCRFARRAKQVILSLNLAREIERGVVIILTDENTAVVDPQL